VDEDNVFYLSCPDQFLFYPNPISQEENIQIAVKNPGGEIIELYDELGRLVIRYDLINPFETLETINLPAGIYFYHILREEERIQEGKIIIK
jgi:exopolysaccharide biosynthesis predicted pyruvyltransferase EpsI